MGTKVYSRQPRPQDRLRFLQARAVRAIGRESVGDMAMLVRVLRKEMPLVLEVSPEQQLATQTAFMLLLYHLGDYEQASLVVERIWRIVRRAPRLHDPVPAELVQALFRAGYTPRRPQPRLALVNEGLSLHRGELSPHLNRWSRVREGGVVCPCATA